MASCLCADVGSAVETPWERYIAHTTKKKAITAKQIVKARNRDSRFIFGAGAEGCSLFAATVSEVLGRCAPPTNSQAAPVVAKTQTHSTASLTVSILAPSGGAWNSNPNPTAYSLRFPRTPSHGGKRPRSVKHASPQMRTIFCLLMGVCLWRRIGPIYANAFGRKRRGVRLDKLIRKGDPLDSGNNGVFGFKLIRPVRYIEKFLGLLRCALRLYIQVTRLVRQVGLIESRGVHPLLFRYIL